MEFIGTAVDCSKNRNIVSPVLFAFQSSQTEEYLMKRAIVEVLVTSADGDRIPVGLMNTEQALSLPPEIDIEVSHPAHQAGSTDIFMDRGALQDHVDITP
jgi:hypothetical protein